jgi:5,10-methylenetetrahydromethanopterin reductase
LNNLILDSLNLNSSETIRAGSAAVKLGYEKLWVTEGIERESLTLAAAVAPYVKETRTEIGTNLTNVYTRTPLLIAMTAISMDELTNQKFFLTLGTGGIGFIEKCHGVKFAEPVARLREYFTLVRKLLTTKVGEKISFKGKFTQDIEFRSRSTLQRPHMDIYTSALNPRMIQLAGEISDGIVLSHMPVESLDAVKRNLEIGAKKAGRDYSEVKIFVNSPVSLDNEKAIESLKKLIAFHIAAPTYQFILTQAGLGSECEKVRTTWESGDIKGATAMITDDIIRTVGLGYREKDIRDKAQKLESRGAVPIIYPAVRHESQAEDVIEIAKICKSIS